MFIFGSAFPIPLTKLPIPLVIPPSFWNGFPNIPPEPPPVSKPLNGFGILGIDLPLNGFVKFNPIEGPLIPFKKFTPVVTRLETTLATGLIASNKSNEGKFKLESIETLYLRCFKKSSGKTSLTLSGIKEISGTSDRALKAPYVAS